MNATYQTALKMLHGRQTKKIANNTYARLQNGDSGNSRIFFCLHSTDIVTVMESGTVVLNSGGWHTPTTKERMNLILGDLGLQLTVYQNKSVWYLGHYPWQERKPSVVYADGISILANGEIIGQGEDAKAIQKQVKRINKYAADFIKALFEGQVPAPSNGDCWYCLMVVSDGEDKGKTLGEAIDNKDHIESHLEENHFVPSLLMRALDAYPTSQAAMWALGSLWGDVETKEQKDSSLRLWGRIAREQLASSLKRYIKHVYGIASK